MADATPAPADGADNQPAPDPTPPPETGGEEQVDYKSRAEAQQKVNRDLERKLKAAQADIDKARQAGMSEAEKAIAEAETRGRSAATTEFGKRLARTQFDALAGRRNPAFDTASALEYVDLAKFVGDDGEPDTAAITAAVERLIPEPTTGGPAPSPFDLGNRGAPAAPSSTPMNDLIRRQAGRR